MPVTATIDVEYLAHPRAIACCLLESEGQIALVDPGPSISLPVLRRELQRRGIAIADLNALFLTHIHLDHAGASGTLLRENPRLRVYVHELGARHMADPAKLLASAGRLYNPGMEARFGEFLPVPRENIVALKGGEDIPLGARRFEILYTPGHASHHVTWFEPSTGDAFIGDTGGIRMEGVPFVVPVSPPPDIDLGVWRRSMDLILSRLPARLYLTHFGWSQDPGSHFDELRMRLESWAAQVRGMLGRSAAAPSGDGEQVRQPAGGTLNAASAGPSITEDPSTAEFSSWAAREIHGRLAPELAAHYVSAAGLDLSWLGLARYWRKRAAAEPQSVGTPVERDSSPKSAASATE